MDYKYFCICVHVILCGESVRIEWSAYLRFFVSETVTLRRRCWRYYKKWHKFQKRRLIGTNWLKILRLGFLILENIRCYGGIWLIVMNCLMIWKMRKHPWSVEVNLLYIALFIYLQFLLIPAIWNLLTGRWQWFGVWIGAASVRQLRHFNRGRGVCEGKWIPYIFAPECQLSFSISSSEAFQKSWEIRRVMA